MVINSIVNISDVGLGSSLAVGLVELVGPKTADATTCTVIVARNSATYKDHSTELQKKVDEVEKCRSCQHDGYHDSVIPFREETGSDHWIC